MEIIGKIGNMKCYEFFLDVMKTFFDVADIRPGKAEIGRIGSWVFTRDGIGGVGQ